MGVRDCTVQGVSPGERAGYITRFIELARELLALRNYGTVWSIITGLNVDIVSRLHQSWSLVPQEAVQQLQVRAFDALCCDSTCVLKCVLIGCLCTCAQGIRGLFDTTGLYATYRTTFSQLPTDLAVVPYLGAHTKELTVNEVHAC